LASLVLKCDAAWIDEQNQATASVPFSIASFESMSDVDIGRMPLPPYTHTYTNWYYPLA
jgi:hypothetical protein